MNRIRIVDVDQEWEEKKEMSSIYPRNLLHFFSSKRGLG
jgi:hypothetical protein